MKDHKTIRVLFVGNSHTYMNDMPQLFRETCERTTGVPTEVTRLAFSGRHLRWHLSEYFSLRFALLYGGYDYCVIQQAAHPFPPREEKPYEQKWQQGAAPQAEDRNRRFGRAEEVPHFGQQSVPNNVSYMPNVFVGDNGVGYRHVERLTQPVSASTCYRLIEFMRNGESVIVNTELIRSSSLPFLGTNRRTFGVVIVRTVPEKNMHSATKTARKTMPLMANFFKFISDTLSVIQCAQTQRAISAPSAARPTVYHPGNKDI